MVELIAVHVPKTAGITFQRILNQVYGTQHIYYDYLDSSIPRVYQPAEIPPEFRVIHGHFPIAKYDDFFPNAKRIIWLRHPVHLLVSLYFYWLHLPLVNDNHTIVGKIQTGRMGIDEFVEQLEVRNVLYQNTCGKKLSDFYFVGLQEFFQEDLAELKIMLDWPNFQSSYENLNPSPKYHEDIQKAFANQKIIDKLVENNQKDLALYQEALTIRANRRKESISKQPIMAEWNRNQYQLRQFKQELKPTQFNVEQNGELTMKEWKKKFFFNKKEFSYNRIKFNNPTERAVEIPIAFSFLADLNKPASVLEIGNVLSHYENHLSETLGITSRRIVDKFELEVGVDNEDLMNLPSEEKYDAIVSLSTVEHIGQKGDPSGGYGEQQENRDLEAPLKAIAKIYDLLAPNGKALITVPFGKLTDGEWYIQFSKEYLYLLGKTYGIPKEAVSVNCLKLIDRETNGSSFNVLWEELDALELSYMEYGSPFSQANAIAVIELSKLSSDFHLKLNVEPSPLLYYMPYETRTEFEQNKALLQQTQSEFAQFQLQLQQTQSELEQSQSQLHQTQSELEQSQALQHQTQSELEQSQSQLHQIQSELEQSQALHHQSQSELEQSQSQLHQIQSELEQSQALHHQSQNELEQSQLQLHQIQSEFEKLKFWQAIVRETDVKSQVQYKLLLWEGWYAYCKGDRAGMANFLKESLKCTPFSTTETVLNWLQNFAGFSSEKGDMFDTNTLVNSAEWKELMRRSIHGKTALTIH